MGKRQQHGITYITKHFFNSNSEDGKTIIAILAMELAFFFFVAYKGMAGNYLPIILLTMVFTFVACKIAFYFEADRHLLFALLMLLNMGFVVQEIQSKDGLRMKDFLLKFAGAIVVAFVVAFLYQFVAHLLQKQSMIAVLMLLQLAICTVMLVMGELVGKEENQGAVITLGGSLKGITPFEIVKALYVFVAIGLLCQEEEKISIWKFSIKGETVLILHTIALAIFFVLCKELGTLMVILFSGFMMLWIFGKNRKRIMVLIILTIIAFVGVWITADKVVCPMIIAQNKDNYNTVEKLVLRFGAALHPETYMANAGYQGLMALEAIAAGGMFGVVTDRYRLPIPEASNDFIFANLVQTCGFFMGIIMILCFFLLLKRGVEIASSCKNVYFQGIAMGIVLLIMAETVIHIAYNISFFPITGIPLYFVSQGFMAVFTGMAMISVLLVISTGLLE